MIRRHIVRICVHHAPFPEVCLCSWHEPRYGIRVIPDFVDQDDPLESGEGPLAAQSMSTVGLVPATPKDLQTIMRSPSDFMVVREGVSR